MTSRSFDLLKRIANDTDTTYVTTRLQEDVDDYLETIPRSVRKRFVCKILTELMVHYLTRQEVGILGKFLMEKANGKTRP